MTYQLKQGPNGSVIEIDPQLLRDAGIAADAEVEVRSEGRALIISAPSEPDAESDPVFKKAAEFTFRRYDGLLKRLSE